MKLGSLFDGIGGFPLSAMRHGITLVWASEIEAAPISITKRHFPHMHHLGDITRINGAVIEPVDIITFGSPCQDLSIAGKRVGLGGERSGLFGEAIRIIREMKEATNNRYPKYAVWENVPGALSSNKGLDFRAVLEAFSETEIPMPGSGGWRGAGMVRGGRCDIAWRILDAQFWGVPQRRRRIFLVADFGGERAAEILFKPESLRRNFKACGAQGEETAGDVGGGVENTNGVAIPINTQIATRHKQLGRNTGFGVGENGDPAFTIQAAHSHAVAVCPDKARTLIARHDSSFCVDRGGNVVIEIYENHAQDSRAHDVTTETLICVSDTQRDAKISVDLCPTLNCMHEQPYIAGDSIVRRLTPTECERLQGFPDDWTAYGHDGKAISDSARYRALGNSVAIPCVDFVIGGIGEIQNETGEEDF